MKKTAWLLLFLSVLVMACSSSSTNHHTVPSLADAEANAPPVTMQEGDFTGDDRPIGLDVGFAPPDFSVTTTNGKAFNLRANKGKPTLVYFFATWCPHCRNDFNTLKKVYPKFKDQVDFIALGMDLSEGNDILASYTSKFNIVGMDVAQANPDTLKDFKVRYTTTKYAVAGDGSIIYSGSGEFSEEQWRVLLSALL